MASWQQIRQYISESFTVNKDLGESILLQFNVEGQRSQLVMVSHHQLMDGAEDWLVIESPIGPLARVDLQRALVQTDGMTCGGLGVLTGQPDLLAVRHAVPLENLDLNEFQRPLGLVTVMADTFEAAFIGGDQF
jgi:hypothetical protein